MSHETLVENLTNAMRIERALAIQIQNISSTLNWSGLPGEGRAHAAESLGELGSAAERRARKIKNILDRIEGGAHNVL